MIRRHLKERGIIASKPKIYGKSLSGTDLEVWYPESQSETDLLVIAGIHGDEPEGTILLSAALRSILQTALKCAVILGANPDGLVKATRCNQLGVDLNRNFPTTNWQATPLFYKWFFEEERKVEISPGEFPGSEPETCALLSLISELNPRTIVSIHSPAAVIDDPETSELGSWLSKRTGLPQVSDLGLPTPGSLGTWGLENDHNVVTYELPDEPLSKIRRIHEPVLVDLLTQNY